MSVANDKPNDLRVDLSLPGAGAPTLDRVRVLLVSGDSVMWEAGGSPTAIEELSYGDLPGNFNEVIPPASLAAGGRVVVEVSGAGVRGELQVSIKED